MSDQEKTTPPVKTIEPAKENPVLPNIEELIAKVKEKAERITKYQLSKDIVKNPQTGEDEIVYKFIGKPGFNPYLYIAQNVTPILDAIEVDKFDVKGLQTFLALDEKVEPNMKNVKPANLTLREYMRAFSDREQARHGNK